MSLHYYNEIDRYCVQWLNNLIDAGQLPMGVVDDRPIQEVQPEDLEPYTSCHFFAGLGGWPYALRLGGWPEDRPVWTGSCPCQPFSGIGKLKRFSDPRHLWPEWFRLIPKSCPSTIFGEQVENAALWLDLVLADLEGAGYACGAAYLPAASVGARHERQRLWFVANSNQTRWADSQGIETPAPQAHIGATACLVPGTSLGHFQRAAEPNPSWIVDGLRGEGHAVAAYGNAVVPQVAAEFIRAYLEAEAEIIASSADFT